MSRAWRIEYNGALYQLISRGNERSDIFIDKVDRNGFSDAIEEMSERFEIDVFDSVMFLSPYPYNFPVSQSPSFPASQLLPYSCQ